MPGHQHMFSSRAQWRWAFATHKPWAHRWAETNETSGVRGYHAIARRKRPPSAARALRALMKPGR
jgi:hypothetical protein